MGGWGVGGLGGWEGGKSGKVGFCWWEISIEKGWLAGGNWRERLFFVSHDVNVGAFFYGVEPKKIKPNKQ